ncbi:MAG: dihydropyrimidine dehydrogenase [Halobacteriales archaeon]
MFEPRLALASLSGQSDAAWAKAALPHAGAAFLGGIAVDKRSRAAARRMVADRDREEFLPADPLEFIDTQLAAIEGPQLLAGFNVRSTAPDPVRAVAAVCTDHDAIIEVNAHCRQDELCAVGCGEALLKDTERLCEQVAAAAEPGAPVSVKVRTEVPGVDLPTLAPQLVSAGATVLHIDAMDSEPIVREVVEVVGDEAFIIANNGVRGRRTAYEYLKFGADAVSVGRPSDDPAVLARVKEAVEAWFAGASEVRQSPGLERP